MLNINYTNHWNGEKINSTIQQSIIDTFGKLRYQAKDDPKAFKDILKIIILDDMIEWSNSVSGMQSDLKKIQQKLRDLQTQFILCNPAFSKQYIDSELAYVNVNTPQSSSTWKRVWDSEQVTTFMEGSKLIGCNGEECIARPRVLVEVNPNIIIKDIF